jgi:biopolymer transport protein ExbB
MDAIFILANAGVKTSEATQGFELFDIFEKGGALMYVLVGLSFIALMAVFVCLWTTRASAVLPRDIVLTVESYIRHKDYAGLLNKCEADGSSFARTVHVIVQFMQRNQRASMDAVREVASAEATRQANILTRQINWLSDIGSISPMVGLLGTVLGMMSTFLEMAQGNFEGVKQMQMASGISEAMITTAGGLFLAIPCMLAYAVFRNRIQKHITDMEVAVTHILSVIAVQMDRERRLSSTYQRGTAKEVLEEEEF